MSSPDVRGPRTPKRHPACPGKSKCQLQGCIHNAQNSRFSTDEISVDLYDQVDYGLLGAYPSVRFAGGNLLYQRLGAASELVTNVREINDEPKEAIGMMMYTAQTKIREVSGIVLDKIRSCLSYEMPL